MDLLVGGLRMQVGFRADGIRLGTGREGGMHGKTDRIGGSLGTV